MPSDMPPSPVVAGIPYFRFIALSAGFFVTLALLLVAASFVPAPPPL
jgi:hypothetical protein